MPGDRPPITGGLNVTQEAQATVNLGKAAAEIPVADQIALRDQALRERDQDLRDWMAKVVIPAFLKANGWTLIAIGGLGLADVAWVVRTDLVMAVPPLVGRAAARPGRSPTLPCPTER